MSRYFTVMVLVVLFLKDVIVFVDMLNVTYRHFKVWNVDRDGNVSFKWMDNSSRYWHNFSH